MTLNYINTKTFACFEYAYKHALFTIADHGIETSPRGRTTKEVLGLNFGIENPRMRLIGFESRELNIFYCIGNFLWVISQSDDVDFISYYNPRGNNFSDDGKKLPGAYGKRIFDKDGVNQYHQCIQELKVDPDSRRAIISIHMPQHDWRGVLDTPCTATFQVFIREGKLHMINHMRSQSVAMVMPYDVFLMTMIQEYMALELGVEIGPYIHFCNSGHYFENEQQMVDDILRDKYSNTEMPKMEKVNIKKFLEFEKLVRQQAIVVKATNQFVHDMGGLSFIVDNALLTLKSYEFPEYWNQIGKLLIIKALKHNGAYDNRLEESIWNCYKIFL